MDFKDKLKQLRNKNNETQQDLANKLNISFQSVSKWEKGLCLPSISLMKDLAKHYNVTLESLLEEEKNLESVELKVHTIKYHPVVNKASYFSIFLEKDKLYPSRLAKDRYRTDASHNHRASDDKNSYVIAVNSEGKIIYMALGTGHCKGSPCDPFYHPKEIVGSKDLDCFCILDSYRPFGDGSDHFMDFEFIIPQGGFVITLNNNSYEIKTLFSFITKGDNESWIDFRRFKNGELDQFNFKFEDDTLIVSYKESSEDYLKKSLDKKVFNNLFKEYIKNNKEEILKILNNEIINSINQEIEEMKEEIESIYDDSQEALSVAEEALSIVEEALENKE